MTELNRHKEALKVAVDALNHRDWTGCLTIGRCEQALEEINAILNPPIEMETVEITGWFVVPAEGDVFTQVSEERGKQMRDEGYTVVSLTVPSKRPVKRAVVREVSVDAVIGGQGAQKAHLCHGDPGGLTHDCPFADHPECHGKTGKLIFQWTE